MQEYAHLANAPRSGDDGSTQKAILAGLVAAVAGGVAWWLILAVTNYELGIVAWGLGGLVGFAMAASTSARNAQLGATAAGLALLGLVLGKVLIAQFVLGGVSADDLLEDPDIMTQAAVYHLEVTSGFPPAVQAVYDTVPPGAEFSAELWNDLATAADAHLAGLGDAGRREIAEQFAARYGSLTLTEGIMAQLSGFDLLWMFLALGTAWKMMAHRDEELAHTEPQERTPQPV